MQDNINALIGKIDIPSGIRHPHWAEAEFYYRQGKKCEYLGQIKSAIEDYTKAIQLSHWHADAYYRRGWLSQETADFRAALKDLHKASDLYSGQMDFEHYQKVQIVIRQLRQLCSQSLPNLSEQTPVIDNNSNSLSIAA